MPLGELGQHSVEHALIDTLYQDGSVPELFNNEQNSYHLLKGEIDPKHSALALQRNGRLYRTKSSYEIQKLKARDLRQMAMMDSLLNPDILVCSALGMAGTGKTSIALAYAIDQAQHNGRAIYLTKPACLVGSGRAFGPIPGDVGEKYAPFLASYMIVLRRLLGDHADELVEQLTKQKRFEYVPIEYVRGCTFDNAVFIIDEVQNLPWHELNSVMTRVGENSKLILLGDLNQIDIRLDVEETGIYRFLNSRIYQESGLTSTITLTEQYRSKITELVCRADQELRGTNDGRGVHR